MYKQMKQRSFAASIAVLIALAATLSGCFDLSRQEVKPTSFDSPLSTPMGAMQTKDATSTYNAFFDSPLPTPTKPYIPPTPTTPPFPTPIPTPVVVPLPTAQPPIIPLPPGEAEIFTIVFPDGNMIRAIDSDGGNERTLIDIRARLSLFLASEKVRIDPWSWASVSPDSRRLAVVLSNVEMWQSLPKGERPKYSIYLYDLDTGDLLPLVQDGLEPVWSPDGTRIAYRSTQTSGLWIVEISTGETYEAYAVDQENEHFVTNIDWSPDNTRLVFLDKVFRQSTTIVAIDASGVEPATVLVPWESGYWLSYPRWSPDGEKILFVSLAGRSSSSNYFYNLWVVNADGTEQTQITHDINLSGGSPCWSPDGQWIIFTGTPYYEEMEPLTDLWLVGRTGTELKRLTSNALKRTNEGTPKWSPDGIQIAFERDGAEVWILSLTDGVQRRLPSVTTSYIILR